MLRVPELKPGEEAFDPEFSRLFHPELSGGKHMLHMPKPYKNGDDGVLLQGFENEYAVGNVIDPEVEEENRVRAILNHAVVKDAVTQLHREDDEQLAVLEQYDGMQICDIKTDHERFLKAQMNKYGAMFKNEAQISLFREMTEKYFGQSRERAKQLQMGKVRQFWGEVVTRQNEEFAERALRNDVVFDDMAVTGYRDLIFYNLENLLAALPSGERKAKMDAAGRAFYCKVLDKRLELGPERLQSMLDAKEIRRVLDDAVWKEYLARAKAALLDDALREKAIKWVEDGIEPLEAKKRAKQIEFDSEREAVLRYYGEFRIRARGSKCFIRLINIGQVWNRVKNGGYQVEAIPEWVRRNDPDLYAFLMECLEKRENNGGRPWPVQWSKICPFFMDFSLRDRLEQLCEEENCFKWILATGGPESDVWSVSLRLLAGKSTKEDELFLRDIQLAWGEGRDDAFMERFIRERSVQEPVGELGILEILEKMESLEKGKVEDIDEV